MSIDPEDVDLIGRVASGDGRALDEIMRRHEDLVFAVCLRLMGSRDTALDATQETFLTVFRKADRYRAEAAFTTWLYRVATNTCYDLLRKAKRRRADPLPEHHDPADASSSDAYDSVDVRPSIEAALMTIPEDYRAAVVLSDIHGMAMAEISEILEIPVGTAKSRVFRGRRLLAEILGNLAQT
jgi:RNA polymerase sigma-70 factor (ECF subfamily)